MTHQEQSQVCHYKRTRALQSLINQRKANSTVNQHESLTQADHALPNLNFNLYDSAP